MFRNSRSAVITAAALVLWALPAMAALATTAHALHHHHELDHSEDHWLRVSEWMSHGHEHAMDTPEHEHKAVSPSVTSLPRPRRDAGAQLAAADADSNQGSALPARACAGGEPAWGWRLPPARPSPGTARHQILCVLLL